MPNNPEEHWEYTINEWSRPPFTDIINALPENIKVLYDIGANAGGFTHILKEKYPKLKAYCFEPIKSTCQYLRQAVPYATVIEKGVYYGKTESRAVWRGSNMGAYFVEHIDAVEPRVFTEEIMELCELEGLGIKKPDIIKMDIEGAEENVIEFSQVVKECPYLIIEWHPSRDQYEFFRTYLNHEIVVDLEGKQFLLKKK